jgi:hypothetical protein
MRLVALALIACLCPAAEWRVLFDGQSREGWTEAAFKGHGEVRIEDGAFVLEPGKPMTGINYTGALPASNYEVRFEAKRIAGNDFFASLTFPVGESFCTLVTGGWGGDIVGLSSIDGWDAANNETRTYVKFEDGRWYKFRLQVSEERIRVWIDDEKTIDVEIAGRNIELRRGDIKLSAPFGFASYNTRGAVRNVAIR